MDQTRKNQLLLFGPALALGGASCFLHRHMMAQYIDEKGLLVSGNLPGLLLWASAIAFVLTAFLVLSKIGGEGTFADSFGRCVPRGAAMVLGGALLLTMLPEVAFELPIAQLLPQYSQVFQLLSPVPGLAAAGSMILAGICRVFGKKPPVIFHFAVCLFYMLTLIAGYSVWSADPQLHHYVYQHLALVLLMLCAFHRACCDAGILQRKKLLFTALAAVFCSLAALGGEYLPRLYLASALWAFGCTCDPTVLPPDPEEDECEELPEQPGADA